MIALNDVSKTFFRDKSRVEALKNVTLEIGRGEIFGVIGYSGAGKSTLLRCMNMLEQPTSGTVTVNGVKLTELPEKELQKSRRKIGMIFQHFNLLSSSTVFSNVAAPLRLVHTPRAEIDQKVFELLELVGLTEQAQAYPAQLSGGQKQRVGIARALANEPEILLCDEATSALDPETTDSILDLLLAINQRLNLTIVFVTHEMHVVQKICDRVAIMEHGEVIEQGKVLDLFTRPQTPTAKKFIGTIVDTRVPDKIFNLLQQEIGFFQLVPGNPANPRLTE